MFAVRVPEDAPFFLKSMGDATFAPQNTVGFLAKSKVCPKQHNRRERSQTSSSRQLLWERIVLFLTEDYCSTQVQEAKLRK